MAGAGILALAHAGFHGAPEAKDSADWILQHNFDAYNAILPLGSGRHDRYHYALFTCCQAMYQLGGQYWQRFFPRTVATLLANQQPDGSWPADSHWHDGQFGTAYTTALVLMTLGAQPASTDLSAVTSKEITTAKNSVSGSIASRYSSSKFQRRRTRPRDLAGENQQGQRLVARTTHQQMF